MVEAEMMRDNSEKGFSLIEVMIALVVLLVGMLGIMGMQYYAVSGNATSRELRLATNLGQDMIESLQTMPYATVTANVSSTDSPDTDVALTGGVVFTRRWWVHENCIALDVSGATNICTNTVPTCPDSTPGGAGVSVPVSAIRTRVCWTDKSGGVTFSFKYFGNGNFIGFYAPFTVSFGGWHQRAGQLMARATRNQAGELAETRGRADG